MPLTGTYSVVVQVTDTIATVQSSSLTLVISPPPLTITSPASLLAGEATVAYPSTTFTASGGTQPYTWTVTSGNLPTAMTFTGGTLAGTPSVAFSGNVTFQVMDATSQSVSTTLALNIIAAPTITTSSPLPQGELTVAYSQTLAPTGGSGSGYTFSLVTAPPLAPGLGLNTATGAITGTPTATGTFNFSAKVTDGAGGNSTQNFAVTIIAAPTITTPSPLPQGELTVSYSQTLTPMGGSGPPYTWSLVTAPPPAPGLSLNASTGAITGTPTTVGTYNFTVKVTDSNGGFGTQDYTVTINQALSITTASIPQGDAGTNYSQTLALTGGAAPYNWSISSATLPPPGITLSTAGVLNGTTNATGSFSFTVKVTDNFGGSATKDYTLTINLALSITTASIPQGDARSNYSQTLALTGGAAPYNWSISSGTLPPPAITLSTAGVLSGMTSATGSFPFTVKVTDNLGGSATQAYNLTINPQLSIATPPMLSNGTVGVAYSQPLSASGGASPYTWTVTKGSLGSLTLNGVTGTISGTPSSSGTLTFTVQVTDGISVTASKDFTITIASGLIITNGPMLSSEVNVLYSVTLAAAGGTPPYTWSITSGSPGNLSLNSSTGVISGTPTASGTFIFTAQVKDNNSVTATEKFTLTIAPLLTITTGPTLPGGTAGGPYSQVLNASGGVTPYTWSVSSGSLPTGLNLSSGGLINGTPQAPGTFTFIAKATDSASVSVTKQLTLTIISSLAITTGPTLPSGSVGVLYSQPLAVTGGTPPYHWSTGQGALPNGLLLVSSGAISGTPQAAGTFQFTLQVTDSSSLTASQQFTLTIAPGLVIATPSPLPGGSVGSAYSAPLKAVGGTAPYRWLITSGSAATLTLDPATGVLSGTPTAAGSLTFTVQVTDNASNTASKQFTLSIAAGLAITSSPSLPAGKVNVAYSQPLTAAGGTPPYTWSLTPAPPAPGLNLNPSTGVIAGTPTTTGTFTFTVQVKDSASATASLQFSLTVSASLIISTPATLSGVVGTPFSTTLAATGGTGSYTWSITSVTPGPAWLSVTNAGTGAIGGTPKTAGTYTVAVEVVDTNGTTASASFTIYVGLPAAPKITVNGVPSISSPAQQINIGLTLDSGYSLDIKGEITLTFQPDATAPADDPSIQFSTGGRTVNFTVPANTTTAVFPAPQVLLQTGTVAGAITLSFALQAAGADLTVTGLDRTITIARSAPSIQNATVTKNTNGFQLSVQAYSTPRDLSQVHVSFTQAAGANLQTSDFVLDLTSVGTAFYKDQNNDQYGSQFILLLPFTASQGSISAVASAKVDIKNSQGTSPTVTVQF